MFILQFILIIFLVVIVVLFIVLIFVRHMMWRLNQKAHKIFSSKKSYDSYTTGYNEILARKKKIKPDDGDYVDFEEIKP
ncbi:MAG: DUF4834 family protein [Bacteroidales bacterium]|nr:DUF4834 family protein [Bacteroidales bacterium]